MGCAATKSQGSNVVEPMPSKPHSLNKDENNNKIGSPGVVKALIKEGDRDSLRGSKSSVRSASTASRSDRESSAQSTRTADSGFGGGGEYDPVISEDSTIERQKQANVESRPITPELIIEGAPVPRRQSGKDKRKVGHLDDLPPITGQSLISRPQSRAGNLAFDIVLTPDTGNVKKMPHQLPKLERRHKKKSRLTKEQLEEKLKRAEERRKGHEQNLVAKSQSMREHQLKSALQFAKTQEITEEDNDF